MTILGLFGNEIFGRGYFGVVQENIPLTGTVVSPQLEAALSQEVENKQMVDVRVEIAGVDVSALVESISIKSEENRVAETSTIVLIGTAPDYLVKNAIVTATALFRFEDGTEFTSVIFAGFVRSFQPSGGALNKSVNVIAYDEAESALSEAPNNTTWTGTARNLVIDELTAAGFLSQDLNFTDYSMTAVDLTGFTTVRELILAVAGGIDEVVAFIQPSGAFCVLAFDQFQASGITITQKGWTTLQKNDNANQQYKSVTIQGTTGNTGTATGTGEMIYEETSVFLSATVDLEAKAENVVARAAAVKRTMQIPMNPLVRKGTKIQVYDETNTLRTCRVTGVSHFVQWTGPDSSPGAWSSVGLQDE